MPKIVPKIAVMGGTFNPVHCGHLQIAETALRQAQLDRIIWVPVFHPPHKETADMLPYQHRYRMVELAIAASPSFVISAVEQERGGKSYAIDTLADLQHQYGEAGEIQWHWIIGLDTFQTLPRWYAYQSLAQQCCWLVAPRLERPSLVSSAENQTTATQLAHSAAICATVAQTFAEQGIVLRWQVLQMPIISISASLVRDRCRQNQSLTNLVPQSVASYISQHQLYLTSNT